MAERRQRDPYKGSEFGGTDGLVQPPPHDWTGDPAELRMAIVQEQTQDDMERPATLAPSTDQYKDE